MACCVIRQDAGNLILDQTSELELVIYCHESSPVRLKMTEQYSIIVVLCYDDTGVSRSVSQYLEHCLTRDSSGTKIARAKTG